MNFLEHRSYARKTKKAEKRKWQLLAERAERNREFDTRWRRIVEGADKVAVAAAAVVAANKPVQRRAFLAGLGLAGLAAALAFQPTAALSITIPYSSTFAHELPPMTDEVALQLDVVNVKTEFGARGDGSTDDTARIQAAINTGRACYFPEGNYITSAAINVTQGGQRIFGAGRVRSAIKAGPAFAGHAGIIWFNTGEEGPQIQDLYLTCLVPGTTTGLFMEGIPRCDIFRCRITLCSISVDAGNNCGGTTIRDLEAWCGSTTGINIQLAESFDVIVIDTLRVWPFDDPTVSSPTYVAQTGINCGRCDGLLINNSMFICLNQIGLHAGTARAFGAITNSEFDSLNGIVMSDGWISLTSCFLSGGTFGGRTCVNNITLTGGFLNVSSCQFVNGIGQSIGIATGGWMALTGCQFFLGSVATNTITMTGSNSILEAANNIFGKNLGLGGPFIINILGGRATLMGNRCPVDGTGNFISVAADDWHRIVYNATGGWTNSFPAAGVGIYSPN